jgi:hypothetical protein
MHRSVTVQETWKLDEVPVKEAMEAMKSSNPQDIAVDKFHLERAVSQSNNLSTKRRPSQRTRCLIVQETWKLDEVPVNEVMEPIKGLESPKYCSR